MDIPAAGPAGETIDTPRHRALASSTRVAILHFVRRSPAGRTAAEVARSTGRHLSTVREHLEQLAGAGLLVRDRDAGGSPGRPAWRYRAGAVPDPAPGPYRDLAWALVEHLALTEDDPWTAGVAAGRGWGRRLAAGAGPKSGAGAGDRLVTILDRLGFAPRVVQRRAADPAVIHLEICPFLDLVNGSTPDVVCGLHLGVIRGALGAAGASGAGATLTPFGAPTACVVRLQSFGNGDASDERPERQ